ncbi:diheme cytochrome c [Azospirillum soli]|uniref:diheme cytochrome c n=1 Tax=Azospirillum soli TaxID=1304799 RepID=UPI001AE10301|nr:diheme cytochrome c [Azospirillum soli]MBP2314494.1 nitrate/TMAO reductase-like tetraheme cytochrome c subunit [Azospirillum soli]
MRLPAVTLAILAAITTTAAFANEMERVTPIAHAATQKECGECHMAFQPQLLPAASWGRIMDDLATHFGDNASLDPQAVVDIRAYLTSNAGRLGDGRLTRITEQRWWTREHDFRAHIWSRPDVRSKSNCTACHRDADKGLYEDN